MEKTNDANDIKSLIKNADPKKLQQSLKNFSNFLNPKDMKKVKYMVDNINNPKVQKQLASIDPKKITEELNKNPALYNELKKMNPNFDKDK